MRFSRPFTICVCTSLSMAEGFVVQSSSNRPTTTRCTTTTTLLRVATEISDQMKVNDFGSAMPAEVDPHDIIGVKPEELALGISADDFLEWVGTKSDLMGKVQGDNPSWTEARVEEEVSRFMMDVEGTNMYIKYLKDKKMNPRDYAAEAEAELSLSNPRTIATYAAWLIGGLSFGWVRSNIIEPKFASGEWSDIHIDLPFLRKADVATEAIGSASEASKAIIDQIVDPVLQSSADLLT